MDKPFDVVCNINSTQHGIRLLPNTVYISLSINTIVNCGVLLTVSH